MKSAKLANLLPSDDDGSFSKLRRSARLSIQSNDSLSRLSSKSSSINSSSSTSSSSSSFNQKKKRMPMAIPNSPDQLPDLEMSNRELEEEEEEEVVSSEEEPGTEEIGEDSNSFVTCAGSIARPKALSKLAATNSNIKKQDEEEEDEEEEEEEDDDDTDVNDDDEEEESESDDSSDLGPSVKKTEKKNTLSSSGDDSNSGEDKLKPRAVARKSTMMKGGVVDDDDDDLDDADTRKELEKLRSKNFVVADSIDKSQNDEDSILYEHDVDLNQSKLVSKQQESIRIEDSDDDVKVEKKEEEIRTETVLSSSENDEDDEDEEDEEEEEEEVAPQIKKPSAKNMVLESSEDNDDDDEDEEVKADEVSSINMKLKPRNVVRDETSDSSDNKKSSSSSKTSSSSSLMSSNDSSLKIKTTATAKKNVLASSDDDQEHHDDVVNLEQSFNKQLNLKSEAQSEKPVAKKDEDSIIELEDDDDDDEIEIKEVKNNNKPLAMTNRFPTDSPQARRDETPVPSWSPNIDRIEAIKNRIKEAESARQQQQRKMLEMKPLDKMRSEASAMLMSVANSSKFHLRNTSYEEQLKCLRENMLEVLESQPDPEKNYEGMRLPAGINVNLLPHQLYSLKWLRWRENSYPNGSILADDMGLGKTLTILAYLKLQKDEKERLIREKEGEEEEKEEEEDEDEDELASLSKATRLKLKSKPKRAAASRRYQSERLKTLIVLPASLLYQWETEIQTKFEPGTFKYHIYHGPNRKKSAYNLDDNDIVFTTYEVVSREIEIIDSKEDGPRPTAAAAQSPIVRIKWKRVILDEAHRIKNHTTKVNKACCLIEAKYRHAITGTPVHNSYNDFYSLLKFLRMEPLSDMHLWNYLFPKEKAMNNMGPRQAELHAQREKRLNSWLVLLSNYVLLRRTKSDKLNSKSDRPIVDLPPKTIETVSFKLNPEENAIYKKIFKESKERVTKILLNQQRRAMGREVRGSGSQTAEIFVYLLRLRQACCHMSLLAECLDKEELQKIKLESNDVEDLMDAMTLNSSQNTTMNTTSSSTGTDVELDAIRSDTDLSACLERNYTSTKAAKLIEMVDDLLDSQPDDKMVIVSQWTSYLDIVGSMLRKRRIKYVQIRGDVSLFERNEIVKRFNQAVSDDGDYEEDARVMLLSLTAGGVGLNLVGANRLFLLDIHWNPALEQQCSDRIYRVGQKKPVTIYRFLTQSTIEESILNVQKKKMLIADKVCSANTTTGLTASNAKLTLNDFRTLFRDYDEEQQS